MGRIEILCSYLDYCDSFADVGCDHGYCTQYALKSGKCKSAIIADVSAKCLAKAEKLLSDYIRSGVCRSVCCDGLADIPEQTGQVLIAGMGGEEIIKILSQGFIPHKFVLQPMKNVPKLRQFLLEHGCKITADDIFRDDKFYFVIKGERDGGASSYSQSQLFFGRDSLNNPVLKEYAQAELDKRQRHLLSCTDELARKKIIEEINLLTEVLK
ncbi:MAG: class I SAM-dependent methyltransferase [Clostridia bacterium]|nr:class I SAM-dependent methyltransferase [Clostridia bacterium]